MEIKNFENGNIAIGKAVLSTSLVRTLEEIQEDDNKLINEYKENISDLIGYLALTVEDSSYFEDIKQLSYIRELLTYLKSE